MNKIKVSIFIAVLAFSLMGCQSSEETIDQGKNQDMTNSSSSNVSESEEENIFVNLQNTEFYFASGAGGWQTVMSIEKDGSFTGEYSDADMGTGQYYLSNFSGQFTEPVKVNDYTYSVQIAELNYAQEVGSEEQKEEMLYTYADAYGIAGAEEILIYLPGAPLEKLPESYKNWVHYEISLAGDSVTELPFYGLYNETEECGFSSYDIVEHLYEFIEVQSEWAASVEYSLVHDPLNQMEMNELSYQLYQIWDETLNEEWNVLKQTLDDDTMENVLKEQREWIAYKEQEVEKAAAEVGGGSMAALVANQKAAELTQARVYELLEYLED